MKTLLFIFTFILSGYTAIGQLYDGVTYINLDATPNAFAYGDLNNNNYDEMILGFKNKDYISVALNNRTEIAAPVAYSIGSVSTKRDIMVCDINNDQLNEIVFTDPDNSRIGVLINEGNMNFSTPFFYNTGLQPAKVVSANFNNDEWNDLAIINESGNSVTLLYGQGINDKWFKEPISLSTSVGPSDIEIANINGDEYLDILVANQTSQTIGIFYGNSSGFDSQVEIALPLSPVNIEVKDIDKSGLNDIAVVYSNRNTLSLLYEIQNNTYQELIDLQGTDVLSNFDFIINDFNNDQLIDIAILTSPANRDLVFMIGKGNRSFDRYSNPIQGEGGSNFIGLEYTDIRQTGEKGFSSVNSTGTNWYENYPNTNWVLNSYTEYKLWSEMNKAAIGDINMDGILDIVVANRQYSFLSIYHGAGNDAYEFHKNLPTYDLTCEVELVDFNNDSYPDIISGGGKPNVFINDGQGNFTEVEIPYSGYGNNLALCDFNNDDYIDFFVTNALYINNQDNSFTCKGHYDYNISDVISFDYNGDGNQDMAISYAFDSTVKIYSGNGDGTFNTEVFLTTKAHKLLHTDIDNDGKDDLLCINDYEDIGELYLSTGPYPFSDAPKQFNLPTNGSTYKMLDINKDGREDFVSIVYAKVHYNTISANGDISDLQTLNEIVSYYINDLIPLKYDNDDVTDMAVVRTQNIVEIRHGKDTPTSINTNAIQSAYQLFPNPTTDFVKVKNNDLNISSVEISSLNGITLKKIAASDLSNEIVIDIKSFDAGLYILKITTRDNIVTSHKLLKK